MFKMRNAQEELFTLHSKIKNFQKRNFVIVFKTDFKLSKEIFRNWHRDER